MAVNTLEEHQAVVQRLADSAATAGEIPKVLQTHISSVILIGDAAYKLKKPLNLGFLDYSDLEKRHYFCVEECRLNGRFAPGLYLGVVAVTGSMEAPEIGGQGAILDWAVHMRRFDAGAVLSGHADRVTAGQIDQIAQDLARCHRQAEPAPAEFRRLEAVAAPMEENIRQIRTYRSAERARLEKLDEWQASELQRLKDLLDARSEGGFFRECHGDLHLGNIALIDGKPTIFDGIEFSPSLRYIDVMSDLAFLTMDLKRRGRSGMAGRLLNAYLDQTEDYAGLAMLRLYEVYRALVRAKVTAIQASQRGLGADERERLVADLRRYLRLAEQTMRAPRPALLITHGVSGSGKSTLSAYLAEHLPVIWLRSDIERQRLVTEDRYSPEATRQTYARLLARSEEVLRSGYMALVDATFLDVEHRQWFRQLAERLQVPFLILDLPLQDKQVLAARVSSRGSEGKDPSEADQAVMSRQLADYQGLGDDELSSVMRMGGVQVGVETDIEEQLRSFSINGFGHNHPE